MLYNKLRLHEDLVVWREGGQRAEKRTVVVPCDWSTHEPTDWEEEEEDEDAAPIQSGLDEPAFYIKRQTHARTQARKRACTWFIPSIFFFFFFFLYLHSEKTHFLFTSLFFIVECTTHKCATTTKKGPSRPADRERERVATRSIDDQQAKQVPLSSPFKLVK